VHSFIIKLWLEKTSEEEEEGAGTTWRGQITHVPGGERKYLKDLNGIKPFIKPYLEAMGVRVGMCSRLKHWARQLVLILTKDN
jgi:hypothetical protein